MKLDKLKEISEAGIILDVDELEYHLNMGDYAAAEELTRYVDLMRNHFDALIKVAETVKKAEHTWRDQETGECHCQETQEISMALKEVEEVE